MGKRGLHYIKGKRPKTQVRAPFFTKIGDVFFLYFFIFFFSCTFLHNNWRANHSFLDLFRGRNRDLKKKITTIGTPTTALISGSRW
jgi:hypothetical protein